MRIDGQLYRSIWLDEDGCTVVVIDQTRLPHKFGTRRLVTVEDAAHAISTMVVRGAPLIGATAAYGVALALSEDPSDANLENAIMLLAGTRRQRPICAGRWRISVAGSAPWLRGTRRRRLPAGGRDLRRGRCHQPGDWRERARAGGKGGGRARTAPSMYSPIATPAGSPRSTGARRWRRFTWRTTKTFRFTSGSTRPGRVTRALR